MNLHTLEPVGPDHQVSGGYRAGQAHWRCICKPDVLIDGGAVAGHLGWDNAFYCPGDGGKCANISAPLSGQPCWEHKR